MSTGLVYHIGEDSLRIARKSLTTGIENTRELLANRDRDFGRDHRSNRLTAEWLEEDIRMMETSLELLPEP